MMDIVILILFCIFVMLFVVFLPGEYRPRVSK